MNLQKMKKARKLTIVATVTRKWRIHLADGVIVYLSDDEADSLSRALAARHTYHLLSWEDIITESGMDISVFAEAVGVSLSMLRRYTAGSADTKVATYKKALSLVGYEMKPWLSVLQAAARSSQATLSASSAAFAYLEEPELVGMSEMLAVCAEVKMMPRIERSKRGDTDE